MRRQVPRDYNSSHDPLESNNSKYFKWPAVMDNGVIIKKIYELNVTLMSPLVDLNTNVIISYQDNSK